MRVTRRSLAAWGIAGVPLLVTLGQTVMALLGYNSRSVGIMPIMEPLGSITVLFQAAVVFKRSPTLVLGLFLLIGAAWAAQGVSMFRLDHREATYGTATLGGVLFFVLFFGVYAPLFTGDVPAAQLGAFALVPLIATGAMGYAAYSYPWERSVEREANAELGTAESELDAAEETFTREFDRRLDGELATLADVAPEAVRDARESKATFDSTVTEIRDRIDRCRSLDAEERHRATTEIDERVSSLDPDARLDEIERDLRDRLADRLRAQYDPVSVRSPFGESYNLVNLPTDHREFDIPGTDGTVHVDRLGETLASVATDRPFSTVAAAVDAVDRQLDRTRTYLDREATPVVEAVETTTENVETVEQLLEDDRLTFPTRLREILIDGRTDAVTGTNELRREVETAKRHLHEGEFEAARRTATAAETESDSAVVIAEFARAVSGGITGSARAVTIPDELSDETVSSVIAAAEARHDRSVSVDGGQLLFGSVSADTTEEASDDHPDDGQASGEQSVTATSQVVDEVIYAFREFASNADPNDRVYNHELSDLPDPVATKDVLTNVSRFADRQSDLFDEVALQSPEPPGFIEFTAADSDVGNALEETLDRFRDRYS